MTPSTRDDTSEITTEDDLPTIYREFQEFESTNDLYNISCDDVLVWERVRHDVFKRILREKGVFGTSFGRQRNMAHPYSKTAVQLVKSMMTNNPFFADSASVVFLGKGRRKKRADGYWWDIYCDPILEQGQLDYAHLEMPYRISHRKPAKTTNLYHLDPVVYAGKLQEKLDRVRGNRRRPTGEKVRRASTDLTDRFSCDVDLEAIVSLALSQRRSKKPLYERILNRISPTLAVIVCSYGKETFVEVCKELQIPVIELQHGVIHEYHTGYSFPSDRSKTTFPDYLFTFGEYWNDVVEYPLPDERVISVGYPYLDQSVTHYDDVRSWEQILFISQGTIGEQLSKFALEVDRHPDIDHEIVYKLHPGEYDRWETEYPWLVEADFEIVAGSDRQLYRLFAESSVQIGVGSTAVFEGLAFDLETYVYDCPGEEVLQPLVDDGTADRVATVDHLASVLGYGNSTFDREYYFAPGATERACTAIERLANEGTVYRQQPGDPIS